MNKKGAIGLWLENRNQLSGIGRDYDKKTITERLRSLAKFYAGNHDVSFLLYNAADFIDELEKNQR